MQLSPIVTRLLTVEALDGRVYLAPTVSDAAEMLTTKAQIVPMSVLTAAREKASASQRLDNMPARHQVTCNFTVATAVRYAGNAMQAADDLDDVVRSVRAALLGWIPSGYDRQCYYLGGQLLPAGPGVLIWGDSFDTIYSEDAL
jgi:hypothetical protein